MTDDTLRAAQPLTEFELAALRGELARSNGPDDYVGNAVFGGPEEAEEMAARLIATLDAATPHAASATDEGETEPCPTCMQPVPVPQRGDHDYGIPLVARPAVPALDVEDIVRAHTDIVTMYANHDDAWDAVYEWHSDPGDAVKAATAIALIVDRAKQYAGGRRSRLRHDAAPRSKEPTDDR